MSSSSTNYNIQEEWLTKIAPKYFEVDDSSLLKSSFLGYMNEVMANSVEDTNYMVSLMYQELFPNRAVLPNSLYSYSALAKFEDFNAVPAKVKVALAIRVSDIIAQSTLTDTDIRELTINKFSTITVDNTYSYILPYDIILTCNRSLVSGVYKWIISPRYDLTIPNPMYSLTAPYIYNQTYTYQDDEYIIMQVYGVQLSKASTTFSVYSQDLVENIAFNCEYSGNLVYFDVFYIEPGSSTRTYIQKYFVDSYVENSEKFCYYEYQGTNKLEISFSALNKYFQPEYNSQLVVDIYTTEGANANFEYTGNTVGFKFNTELDYGSTTLDPTNMKYECQLLSASEGGSDPLDLAEIRNKISNEFSNRKNIITETDLQTYFNSLNYNSIVKFYKKRDDVIERVYNAFGLLNSTTYGIIPTNTVEILAFEDDFEIIDAEATVLTIPAGKRFERYDETLNYFRKNDTALTSLQLMTQDNDPNVYTYGNPFLIKVRKNPMFLTYYLNSTFKSYRCKCTYINNKVISEFIVSQMKVERNAITSSSYKFTVNMYCSVSPDAYFSVNSENTVINDFGFLKVRGFLKDGETITGYFQFTPKKADFETNLITWEAELVTDDAIDSRDWLNLTDSVYRCNALTEIKDSKFSFKPDTHKIEIGVFYTNGNNVGSSEHGPLALACPDLEDYYLSINYETSDYVNLITNMDNLINSPIITKIDNREGRTFYYLIRQVPLIRYTYLQDSSLVQDILSMIDDYKAKFNDISDTLHNNYSLNFKFYNSYGKSQNFVIGSEGTTYLNRVGLSLSFVIKLVDNVDTELDTKIRQSIMDFITETNTHEVKALYMSDITNHLRANFSEIVMIEFKGYNDYGSSSQSITLKDDDLASLTKLQRARYVPEYLNTFRKYTKDSTGATYFIPDLTIKYL